MKRPAARHIGVDLVKVVAAQLIVLHHFAWYGPTWNLPPGVVGDPFDWFAEYGRLAVQAFLVAGGFLAAQGLAAQRASLVASIVLRYARLVVPMACALLLSIAAAALARPVLPADLLPAPPTFHAVWAHLLLLQDVMQVPSLSAGLWYVAIDFQLSALFVVLAWTCRSQRSLSWAVLGLAAASLLYLNRQADFDSWAPYFFGAYALGITAAWSRDRGWPDWPLWLMLAMTSVALFIEWRTRLAVALAVALLLAGWPAFTRLDGEAWLQRLSRSSYALFLVHYPVLLAVDSAVTRFAPHADAHWGWRLVIAWLLSMAAADLFERLLERPLTAGVRRMLALR